MKLLLAVAVLSMLTGCAGTNAFKQDTPKTAYEVPYDFGAGKKVVWEYVNDTDVASVR